jgi:hypothetical protein
MNRLWEGDILFGNPDNLYAKSLETVNSLDQRGEFDDERNSYKARGALALQLRHDIRMPIICQQWFESPVAMLNPLHRDFVDRLLPGPSDPDALANLSDLESNNIVDFGELDWKQVLELRRSRFWRNFKDQMNAIGSNCNYSSSSVLWDELWRYTEETFPRLGRASILGVLGSLPFPGSAIIGLTSSAFDIADAMKAKDDFGWLYFLIEARKKAEKLPQQQKS